MTLAESDLLCLVSHPFPPSIAFVLGERAQMPQRWQSMDAKALRGANCGYEEFERRQLHGEGSHVRDGIRK
jgi:hypothetical protein